MVTHTEKQLTLYPAHYYFYYFYSAHVVEDVNSASGKGSKVCLEYMLKNLQCGHKEILSSLTFHLWKITGCFVINYGILKTYLPPHSLPPLHLLSHIYVTLFVANHHILCRKSPEPMMMKCGVRWSIMSHCCDMTLMGTV